MEFEEGDAIVHLKHDGTTEVYGTDKESEPFEVAIGIMNLLDKVEFWDLFEIYEHEIPEILNYKPTINKELH